MKILSISEPNGDGTRSLALDDGSVAPIPWNEGDALPPIGSEWPPAPQGATIASEDYVKNLEAELTKCHMEIEQHLVDKTGLAATIETMQKNIIDKDNAIRGHANMVESLQIAIADLKKSIPDKLREAAAAMEGKDHPSAPAVANLDDMPKLDTLKPAKTVEQLEAEKTSSAA